MSLYTTRHSYSSLRDKRPLKTFGKSSVIQFCWIYLKVNQNSGKLCTCINYFMESASERYLYTSCWRIWENNLVSEANKWLIPKRVRKYLTKHFPYCNLHILYLLRFSSSTRFSPLIRHNKCQVKLLFCLSGSTLSLLQKPSVNIFRIECLHRHHRSSCVWFVSLALLFVSCLLRASRRFVPW